MGNIELIGNFIRSEIINDGSPPPGLRDNLIETGVIDSLGILKLIAYIEKTFSVSISDEELMPENFETIEAIALLLKNKITA